jgi:hypothetical protein
VAEQFGFKQVLGNRAAVDADHLLVLAGAVEVDCLGDELFSGTRLTLDQYRCYSGLQRSR